MSDFDIDTIAEIHRQIRTVLARSWDPIGLGDDPYALHEYSGYVRGAYDVALKTHSPEAVARHLLNMERERMGLEPRSFSEVLPVGEKIVQLVSEISEA